ncbi:MAG: thiamine pyrophosphate-dependent dehydrogenase E1 component subunit alpha [Parachlamydiaceae bacterium]|nr:thiamine pyrophosphate-dependent dehydrogenase E1 component subunit alpha [Parachlamydiaceae bacterium]
MQIPTIQYLSIDGELSPQYHSTLSNDQIVKGYRDMVLTRYVDERMITLQRQGSITFAMSAAGEEACSVASAAALTLEDWMYPQYREAGIMFWRGWTVPQYIHHMFGNREDLIFGRQMPNHFGSKALNVVTVSSPIGTKIPHAAGCAYAMKLQKEKTVAICYFGEGASSEGDFHAGLNFAAVRKAPAIFFCRNNGYAISTPSFRQFASEGVADKGSGYGMKTFRVDGNDFFAVHEVVSQAREHCVSGHGPVLIEAMTYRIGAHSTSDDPTLYRKDDEVKKWQTCCPILRLRRYLERQQLWDEKKEALLIQEINDSITKAIAIAKETERPPLQYLIEHVYFEVPQSLKEQMAEIQEQTNHA